jgi:peptidoglycan/xylan/chitin deacetylase (PgdA/CDA1 family)
MEVMVSTRLAQRLIPILMYHSISRSATSGFWPCVVPPELFEEHLSYLKQHRYNTITVTQLVQAMARDGEGLPPQPVVLTFDDGYMDFYTSALPALQRYGFVATLYIATAYVGGTSRWLQRLGEGSRPMLSWPQLAEISASGIECGAHSHTHRALDMLPPSEAENEIVLSKRILEEHLGQQVPGFAYPYGYYSARTRHIVQVAAFSSACAVKCTTSCLDDDPYALARLAIDSNTAIHDLATALTGHGKLVSSPVKRVRASMRQYARSVYGSFRWSLRAF